MPAEVEPFSLALPPGIERLLLGLPALKQSYIVGGGVRDALLGLAVKDIDIEVHGLSFENLAQALAQHGRVDLVGKSFGVIKWTSQEGTFDFSIPRRDSKILPGHKGFIVECDPALGIEEATARRDFTINSLLYDPRSRQILDCHGGLNDLRQRRLRHTSQAFSEDPLRVLRGMQFVARFNLTADSETVRECVKMTAHFPELARERVGEEWMKWAARSTVPSAGLRFLDQTGWIQHFPTLASLRNVPQDPEWHPEGDVFVHTCHCCNAMARLPEWQSASEPDRIVLMFGILAHDFGKPSTTHQAERDGKLRTLSPGHEAAGGPLADEFLAGIGASNAIRERVVPLVVNHLAHMQAGTDRAVRRLAHRLKPETIDRLCTVMTADSLGRPPHPPVIPATIAELRNRARSLALQTQAPQGILLGRHLLELGWTPGKAVGEITRTAFEAQLDGEFQDLPGAFEWLNRNWNSAEWPETSRRRLGEKLATV